MHLPAAGTLLMRGALVFSLIVSTAPIPGMSEDGEGAGYSRQMRMAIDLYESGQDLEAMDRFMEILVKGDPAERPRANEYLNLVTQRMALGTKMTPKEPPRAVVIERAQPPQSPRERGSPSEPEPSTSRTAADEDRERPVERGEERMSRSDREVMKREIEGKVLARQRAVTEQLRKYQDLQIRMASTRLPRAIGIPPSLIYESGIEFKKDAAKLLDLLAGLVYSLGATQVVLLPERALLGDSKIIDMRRTMGISSHLMKAGITPARVRVNLLTSQVDVPQDLHGFQGILVVFVYNQPLSLNTESTIGAESGPPMSLGVSPTSVDPEKGEGSVIEFSVIEPPSGLMSWRFQLLGPGAGSGDDMVVIQEVKGSAPVFHQIYWNGRRQYFGPPLPAGRYECVLSATDMRNRTHKEHEWISILGPAPQPVEQEAPAVKAPAPPPSELPGAEGDAAQKAPKPARAWGKGKVKGKTMTARRGKGRGKAKVASNPLSSEPSSEAKEAGTESGEPAAGAEGSGPGSGDQPAAATPAKEEGQGSSSRSGAVNYQVTFVRNTANITPDGENILGRVADTMRYYPLDNINLVGYAFSGEVGAEKLAQQRTELVEKVLVEQHSLKRDRIKSSSKVVGREVSKVEIYIVAGGQ